jgi:hypothetical protein
VPPPDAVRVTLPPAQNVSAPDDTIAAAGSTLLIRMIVSTEYAQPLFKVHLRDAVLPALTVTAVVGELMVVTTAEPLITNHVPVPEQGAVAAIVNEEFPQCVISAPALAMHP